jgi:hypothetical protein
MEKKFSPDRIFNIDESGISTVQTPGHITGLKGQKQVGIASSWERGKHVTVYCAMSTAGTYIPPMFIFPPQRISPQLEWRSRIGSIYPCSKSGWLNEDLFLLWVKHFLKHTHFPPEDPTLLIMDNRSSHTSLRIYMFCKENGVTAISIPPHTSQKLQPLGISFFAPLKSAFFQECGLFLKNHPCNKITPYDLASLFSGAYMKVATLDKGGSGFWTTGIYLLNPNTFKDDFMSMKNVSEVVIEDNQVVNGMNSSVDAHQKQYLLMTYHRFQQLQLET